MILPKTQDMLGVPYPVPWFDFLRLKMAHGTMRYPIDLSLFLGRVENGSHFFILFFLFWVSHKYFASVPSDLKVLNTLFTGCNLCEATEGPELGSSRNARTYN